MTQENEKTFTCQCRGNMKRTGRAAFVEYGNYNKKRAAQEGGGAIHKCEDCGTTVIEFQVEGL